MSWVCGLLVATGAVGSEPAWLQAGPMLGHVGTNEARIWIKASRDARATVEYSDDGSMRRPRRAGAVWPTVADDFSVTISIKDLRPATRHHYRIRLDGEFATARPYPSFVTTPEPEVEKRFRFGFGSCVGRAGYLDAAAWADMARTNVNFFLMLGEGDEPELVLEVYRVAEGLVAVRKFSWAEITGRVLVPRNP